MKHYLTVDGFTFYFSFERSRYQSSNRVDRGLGRCDNMSRSSNNIKAKIMPSNNDKSQISLTIHDFNDSIF